MLALQKSNLAKPTPSLTFLLEEAQNEAVRVNWLGESSLGAVELLAAKYGDGNSSQVGKAKEFLAKILSLVNRGIRTLYTPLIQDRECELPRIHLLRTSVNRAKRRAETP